MKDKTLQHTNMLKLFLQLFFFFFFFFYTELVTEMGRDGWVKISFLCQLTGKGSYDHVTNHVTVKNCHVTWEL